MVDNTRFIEYAKIMNSVKQIWDTLGTAFSEITEEDKAKIETVWEMILGQAESIFRRCLEQNGNWSVLLAKPVLYSDRIIQILQSKRSNSSEIAEESHFLSNYIVSSDKTELIYTDSSGEEQKDLVTEQSPEYSVLELQNIPDIEIAADSIYYLNTKGFIEINDSNKLWASDGETSNEL